MITPAEIVKEYTKGLMNPSYIIGKYLKTFDKTQNGFVDFNLFPKQKEVIHGYEHHQFCLVTKPRQAGISTTTAAYMSVKVGFADKKNPEKILILANKRDMALEFLSKIKDFIDQLPRWVWGVEYYGSPENEARSIYTTESKQHLILINGCHIKGVATSKDALRGYTPTYLIMDEAAFIDDGAEVFTAALTALGTGGKAFLISTPHGYDDLYYKTYINSKNGDNDFHIIEMRWYEDKRYNVGLTWIKDTLKIKEEHFTLKSYQKKVDEGFKPTSAWYESMCRNMNNNKQMIAQELDVSFVGSGGNVINEDDIDYQEKHFVKEPKSKTGYGGNLWIWEEPIVDHQYILGSDVSGGGGDDFSTISIIDVTTMELVLEYKGKVQPDLLAEIIYEVGMRYSAYSAIDITGGLGVATVLKLLEMKYPYLHYDEPRGRLLKNQRDLERHSKDKSNKIPGFNINANRLPLLSHLEYSIRESLIKITSIRTVGEMKTFVYRRGRPDHMEGYHDDLLFSLGIALWVLEQNFKNLERVNKKTKAMLDGWAMGSGDDKSVKTNFDKFNKGANADKEVINRNKRLLQQNNIQDPNGEYLWLFK